MEPRNRYNRSTLMSEVIFPGRVTNMSIASKFQNLPWD